jgi:hypothetical protein
MKNASWSKDYQSALQPSVLLQIIIGLGAAIATSSRDFLPFWLRAMAVYWGCFIVMVFRRPNTPTKVDLILVKWGFVLVIPAILIISVFIWTWMGVIR